MGSKLGALKSAASKCGCTVELYVGKLAAGLKWCSACETWLSVNSFGRDASRTDGMNACCGDCRSRMHKERYKPKPKVSKRGARFAEIRPGDKLQARHRINHLVKLGLLPRPEQVPCSKCGHLGGGVRHEYHHHLGYGVENQEKAVVECAKCHAAEHKHWPTRKRKEDGTREKKLQ